MVGVQAVSTTLGRPTRDQARTRRERLFACASEAFRRQGFGGASLDAIARAAGISRTTIYRQFGTKAELFRAAALHSVEHLRRRVRTIAVSGRAPEDVLFDYVMLYAEAVHDRRSVEHLRLAIAEQPTFPELAREIHAHMADTFQPLAAYLGELREAGVIRLDDPAAAALDLAALANGGFRFLLVEPPTDAQARERRVRHIVETFLRGVGLQRVVAEPPRPPGLGSSAT